MGLWVAVAVCRNGQREKREDNRGESKRDPVTH